MINAAMVNFAKSTLPAPIVTGVANRNAIDPTPTIRGQNGYNARVDHNLGQNNFFWFRISGTLQTVDGSSGRETIASSQELRTPQYRR